MTLMRHNNKKIADLNRSGRIRDQ
ncbi:hypothetical protein A2U01_0049866, partial [Trifolium medium]|nr:hypothetical protein [Trifolium medium]